jgi:DHA1 family tetracycline resistance protein-like MFS transporter
MEEVGGTLGLSTSIESATRIIAPSLGGYLIGALGAWAPGVLGALIMAWVVPFTYRKIIREKHDSPSEENVDMVGEGILGN